jgi:tRNA U34 5-carboxymethylaminomethyl modifying GTPase MnmE/TrmE
MQATVIQSSCHQTYLATLNRMLELAMQTAEAASTEGNHKIVLQAVREVTRIITLMTKMDCTSEAKSKTPAAPVLTAIPPLATGNSKTAAGLDDLTQDVLKEIFPSLVQQPAAQPKTKNWKNIFSKRGKKAGNYREKHP